MKKRFHDTEIWYKEWFMRSTDREKLAILYLFDVCDNVGIWAPNFTLAETIIGRKISWQKLTEESNRNIEILENGKYFIPDFCYFQYGKLTPFSAPHRSYITLLEGHGLLGRVVGEYKDWFTKECNRHEAHKNHKELSHVLRQK